MIMPRYLCHETLANILYLYIILYIITSYIILYIYVCIFVRGIKFCSALKGLYTFQCVCGRLPQSLLIVSVILII